MTSIFADSIEDMIKQMQNDNDPEVRAFIAREFWRVKDNPTVVDALIKLVEEDEHQVKEAAIEALGEIGNPRAVAALKLSNLAYETDLVKFAIPYLINALNDENLKVRENVARALRNISSNIDIPIATFPLVEALNNPKPIIQYAAEALMCIIEKGGEVTLDKIEQQLRRYIENETLKGKNAEKKAKKLAVTIYVAIIQKVRKGKPEIDKGIISKDRPKAPRGKTGLVRIQRRKVIA